jgi:hypothetical protein
MGIREGLAGHGPLGRAKWAMRAEKWERKKGELGQNQGSWVVLRRKEEKRELGCAESSWAKKRNRLLEFQPDKVEL